MMFGKFFGRRPSPAAPVSLQAAPAPIPLAHAPVYVPLPANSADPVDAEVVRLWIAHQRHARDPSWSSFLAALTATNADLATRMTRAQDDLAHYRRIGTFTP